MGDGSKGGGRQTRLVQFGIVQYKKRKQEAVVKVSLRFTLLLKEESRLFLSQFKRLQTTWGDRGKILEKETGMRDWLVLFCGA